MSQTDPAGVWGHDDFSMFLITATETWKNVLSRLIVMSFSITAVSVVG